MYSIKVNQNKETSVEVDYPVLKINGETHQIDIRKLDHQKYHLLFKNQSFPIEIVSFDRIAKKLSLKIKNNIYQVEIRDKYDELLKNLGLESITSSKIKEIKAPMPGLVLKVLIKEGDQVKKGENLLILEAMKMENIIKAPSDLIIKKIRIESGQTVEKNQTILDLV